MTLQLPNVMTSLDLQKQQQDQETRLCACGCGETFQVPTSGLGWAVIKKKRFVNQAHRIRAWRHNNPDKCRIFQQTYYQKRNAGRIYKVRYQYQNPQKYCRRCNILLDSNGVNRNWRPSDEGNHNYVCKKCVNKSRPRSIKRTPEQVKADKRACNRK